MLERVRLPADVELEDRLAFGLTARQLLLLFATALCAYGGYAFAATVAPLPPAVAAATPLALAGTLLALGRFEGLPADRLPPPPPPAGGGAGGAAARAGVRPAGTAARKHARGSGARVLRRRTASAHGGAS